MVYFEFVVTFRLLKNTAPPFGLHHHRKRNHTCSAPNKCLQPLWNYSIQHLLLFRGRSDFQTFISLSSESKTLVSLTSLRN